VSGVQIIGAAGNKKCNTGSVHKLSDSESDSDSDFLMLAEVSRLLSVYLHLRQLLLVHLLSLLPPNTICVRGIQMRTCILLLQPTFRQYGMESNLATSKSCIPPNQALQSACIRSTFCDNCNLLK
jgi:hypothetical protein